MMQVLHIQQALHLMTNDGDMLSILEDNFDSLSDSQLLDFACPYEMCPNKNRFDSYEYVNCWSATKGNGATCELVGVGNVKIKFLMVL